MLISLAEQTPNQVYQWMTQTIVPRPIAWVLSADPESSTQYNLAPFSYFNAVASDPPIVILSIGKRPDGRDKDTRHNLKEGAHAVIHIPSLGQVDQVNQSAAALEPGKSETDWLNLPLTEFPGSPLPRLADARVAMSARVVKTLLIGRQEQALILLELEQLFVDDALVESDEKGRPNVLSSALDPLARLGASEYAGLGERRLLKRPE